MSDELGDIVPDSRSGRSRAAEDLAAGRAPERVDYEALRHFLRRGVQMRAGISEAESSDIVDEAIAKLAEASASRRVRAGTALAYLKKITRNEAIDRIRRNHEVPRELDDLTPADDDSIARLVDGHASAQQLEAALTRAASGGDHTCVRVVTEYLILACDGHTPSLRAVSERCGLSHTGVRLTLERLRGYLSGD